MSGMSTVLILLAFAAAALAVWCAPLLLDPAGLGAFAFVGQVCAVILALSLLEAVFSRIGTDAR